MNLAVQQCVPCKEGSAAIDPTEAKQLLATLPGWQISTDSKWLTKSYKFKNFLEAVAFVNKLTPVAEAQNHHPDLTLGWGYVGIKLQTHTVGGLHKNDFILAAKIEQL